MRSVHAFSLFRIAFPAFYDDKGIKYHDLSWVTGVESALFGFYRWNTYGFTDFTGGFYRWNTV